MVTLTKTKTDIRPDLGLSSKSTDNAVKILANVLADEFTLKLKLHKYHWNVTGSEFRSLHELFEEQYDALAITIDEVAERLRTYGEFAPGTLSEFATMTRIKEQPDVYPNAHDMVLDLVNDHELMVRHLREDVTTAGDDIGDVGLEDFLTAQLQAHQDMAWMLRSFIETPSR